MKKIILLVSLVLISTIGFSQKKKQTSKKTPITSFAKADNLIAEIKNGNFQLTINGNEKLKEPIVVKNVEAKFVPIDCKLTSFMANGTKLYALTWTEKSESKTDLKTEDVTTVYTNIYEINSNKKVFVNVQITNHITEKVFLDKGKNASETQDKIRREGYEFKLNPDGSIVQKSKTQENKFIFDPNKMEFVLNKKK
jgi:hypothetical protein